MTKYISSVNNTYCTDIILGVTSSPTKTCREKYLSSFLWVRCTIANFVTVFRSPVSNTRLCVCVHLLMYYVIYVSVCGNLCVSVYTYVYITYMYVSVCGNTSRNTSGNCILLNKLQGILGSFIYIEGQMSTPLVPTLWLIKFWYVD